MAPAKGSQRVKDNFKVAGSEILLSRNSCFNPISSFASLVIPDQPAVTCTDSQLSSIFTSLQSSSNKVEPLVNLLSCLETKEAYDHNEIFDNWIPFYTTLCFHKNNVVRELNQRIFECIVTKCNTSKHLQPRFKQIIAYWMFAINDQGLENELDVNVAQRTFSEAFKGKETKVHSQFSDFLIDFFMKLIFPDDKNDLKYNASSKEIEQERHNLVIQTTLKFLWSHIEIISSQDTKFEASEKLKNLAHNKELLMIHNDTCIDIKVEFYRFVDVFLLHQSTFEVDLPQIIEVTLYQMNQRSVNSVKCHCNFWSACDKVTMLTDKAFWMQQSKLYIDVMTKLVDLVSSDHNAQRWSINAGDMFYRVVNRNKIAANMFFTSLRSCLSKKITNSVDRPYMYKLYIQCAVECMNINNYQDVVLNVLMVPMIEIYMDLRHKFNLFFNFGPLFDTLDLSDKSMKAFVNALSIFLINSKCERLAITRIMKILEEFPCNNMSKIQNWMMQIITSKIECEEGICGNVLEKYKDIETVKHYFSICAISDKSNPSADSSESHVYVLIKSTIASLNKLFDLEVTLTSDQQDTLDDLQDLIVDYIERFQLFSVISTSVDPTLVYKLCSACPHYFLHQRNSASAGHLVMQLANRMFTSQTGVQGHQVFSSLHYEHLRNLVVDLTCQSHFDDHLVKIAEFGDTLTKYRLLMISSILAKKSEKTNYRALFALLLHGFMDADEHIACFFNVIRDVLVHIRGGSDDLCYDDEAAFNPANVTLTCLLALAENNHLQLLVKTPTATRITILSEKVKTLIELFCKHFPAKVMLKTLDLNHIFTSLLPEDITDIGYESLFRPIVQSNKPSVHMYRVDFRTNYVYHILTLLTANTLSDQSDLTAFTTRNISLDTIFNYVNNMLTLVHQSVIDLDRESASVNKILEKTLSTFVTKIPFNEEYIDYIISSNDNNHCISTFLKYRTVPYTFLSDQMEAIVIGAQTSVLRLLTAANLIEYLRQDARDRILNHCKQIVNNGDGQCVNETEMVVMSLYYIRKYMELFECQFEYCDWKYEIISQCDNTHLDGYDYANEWSKLYILLLNGDKIIADSILDKIFVFLGDTLANALDLKKMFKSPKNDVFTMNCVNLLFATIDYFNKFTNEYDSNTHVWHKFISGEIYTDVFKCFISIISSMDSIELRLPVSRQLFKSLCQLTTLTCRDHVIGQLCLPAEVQAFKQQQLKEQKEKKQEKEDKKKEEKKKEQGPPKPPGQTCQEDVNLNGRVMPSLYNGLKSQHTEICNATYVLLRRMVPKICKMNIISKEPARFSQIIVKIIDQDFLEIEDYENKLNTFSILKYLNSYIKSWNLICNILKHSYYTKRQEYAISINKPILYFVKIALYLLYNKPITKQNQWAFRILKQLVTYLPIEIKKIYSQASLDFKNLLESYIIENMRDLLVKEELIQNRSEYNYGTKLRSCNEMKSLIVNMEVDIFEVNLQIEFPPAYPIENCSITITDTKPIRQVRQYVFQLINFLKTTNISTSQGVLAWRDIYGENNIDSDSKKCSVCMSYAHDDTGNPPSLFCKPCRKPFHKTCLFEWFSTSQENQCPLCRSEF